MKTEEFLEFVDELSQEPSPLTDREGTSKQDDTVPSGKVEDDLHLSDTSDISENVISSFKGQDISNFKVPEFNGVESIDHSITESQFSSTMPYCEESLVAKLDPEGASQFLSAQPCQKKTQLYLMRVQILSQMWGLLEIALKIVLLVLLLARFLQK